MRLILLFLTALAASLNAQTAPPGDWANVDVGAVATPGSSSDSNGTVTLAASGADIDGTADEFHFRHLTWTGDGVFIARVNSLTPTHPWAKAGVMLRTDLSPGSPHAFMAVNADGFPSLLTRNAAGGDTAVHSALNNWSKSLPMWLCLVRQGNTISGWYATHFEGGIEYTPWIALGTVELPLRPSVYVGLAATSHVDGTLATASFDQLAFAPPPGPPTDLRVIGQSDMSVVMAWTPPAGMFTYFEVQIDEVERNVQYIPFSGRARTRETSYAHWPRPGTGVGYRVRTMLGPVGSGFSNTIRSGTTNESNTVLDFAARALSSHEVELTWHYTYPAEAYFDLYRSTDGGRTHLRFATTAIGARRWLDSGLRDATVYNYVIIPRTPVGPGHTSHLDVTTLPLPATGGPTITAHPASATVSLNGPLRLTVAAAANAPTYQWHLNGVAISGATAATYEVSNAQVAHAGVYRVAVTDGGSTTLSRPTIVGLEQLDKIAGAAVEVASDVRHPNGNVYDQVLLTGSAASMRADTGQVLRVSFLDLNDDIVQVEFSGSGTLAITLDGASGPAAPAKYNQPNVAYMKGHARLAMSGAQSTTHLSVFSVGRANAVNAVLFREGESYDGIADIGSIAILGNGFGSLRTANAGFVATEGPGGLYAPDVVFAGPVYMHDIAASGDAQPYFYVAGASETRIAGGDLEQSNGRAVQVRGISRLELTDGATSHGDRLPAQANRGRLEQEGVDVTQQVVVNPN